MKNRKLLLVMVMSILLSFATSISVFADTTFDDYVGNGNWSVTDDELTDEFIENLCSTTSASWNESNKNALISKVKQYHSQSNEDAVGEGGMAITVNGKEYYLDSSGVNKVKSQIVSAAKKYDVKSSVDQVAEFDVKADVGAAAVALSGIESIVSVIVGILVYGVTIGMTLFTACDICYITMPVFRNKCDDMKASGSVGTKTTSSGETKLMFVTDDAQYAVQSCSIETGRNPLTVYMKKRVLAFILLGLVLFILFTGNIQLIVNVVVNIAAGIIDALSGLGA